MLVGPDLKQWRKDHGLTLEAFAREVKVSWNTILRWELPETAPQKRRPNRFTAPLLEQAIRRIESKGAAVAAA